jgi:hypothetical protein
MGRAFYDAWRPPDIKQIGCWQGAAREQQRS